MKRKPGNMLKKIAKAMGNEESGQALIELAISLPLLLLVLLGGVELGEIAYASIEVTNAAKAAAQFGASNGGAYVSTGLDTQGMLAAANNDAGNLGNSIAFASGYPTMACSCTNGGTATCSVPVTCAPKGSLPSQPIVTVTVQMTTNFNPLIYIPGWSHTSITLYGWAQQEVLPL